MSKLTLTTAELIQEAKIFCTTESEHKNIELFGITDGKAVGTLIEHKFQFYLQEKYDCKIGNSANGIDFPSTDILTDIKVTSIKQPQSSCPFKNAEQKIYGLGYNLLIFVYDKIDFNEEKYAKLNFVSCSFIAKERTGDFTTTKRIIEMINDGAIVEDFVAYFSDRNLPADEITLFKIAENIIEHPPTLGYLTISNALQWRLQYQRIVKLKDNVEGIIKIVDKVNPS